MKDDLFLKQPLDIYFKIILEVCNPSHKMIIITNSMCNTDIAINFKNIEAVTNFTQEFEGGTSIYAQEGCCSCFGNPTCLSQSKDISSVERRSSMIESLEANTMQSVFLASTR
jgi:hypothetical protein